MEEKKFAVLENATYYAGDCQHPSGWALSVATIVDRGAETDCIGTREECEEWLEQLNDEPTYLSHGQAGKSYLIAEIVDDDADYQTWLDGLDWDGCPSEDGSDYDANCAWAEDRAYQKDGILPIQHNNKSGLLLINLTVED